MAVDRSLFVSSSPYVDKALQVLPGVTISQPSVVAEMLELLDVRRGQNVLDVGSGSGYTAALLATLVAVRGRVHSIDVNANALVLAEKNIANLAKAGVKNVFFKHASGWGGVEGKKFDRILVSAAAESIPEKLVDSLVEGGKMVLPLGSHPQEIVLVEKKKDGVQVSGSGIGVVFLRLVK